MTGADAPGRRRPGGQPKPRHQKRIAMSLRVSPGLRARLLAMAQEHGRSITQQSELLLDQAMGAPLDQVDRLTDAVKQHGAQVSDDIKRLKEEVALTFTTNWDRYMEKAEALERYRAQIDRWEATFHPQRAELRKELHEKIRGLKAELDRLDDEALRQYDHEDNKGKGVDGAEDPPHR
jgi:hypothetical protein